MSLARHIDPESVVSKVHEKKSGDLSKSSYLTPYATQYSTEEIPKFRIPENGTPGDTVYELIHDELELDGKPSLNLASFVGTYMPPQADKLMIENMAKVSGSEFQGRN